MYIYRNPIIFLLAVAFMLPACETVSTHPRRTVHPPQHGPPAHAPAHGYRKKHGHDNVELVWDSGTGVYVVVGYEGHYFSQDVYYRVAGEHWEFSVGIEGPWKLSHDSKVPPGLKIKKHKSNQGKGKHKGKGNGHGRKY